MPTIALCLFAGGLSLHGLTVLPGWPAFAAGLVIALVSLTYRPFRWIAIFGLGFSTTGLAASLQLDDRLDPELAARTLAITAVIDEFGAIHNGVASMIVRPLMPPALPARIRLTWFEPQSLPRLGETWRLAVRLRRPAGFANPGGFDQEGWLFRSRIGATGYVVEQGRNYRIVGAPEKPVDRLRRHLVERLSRRFADGDAAAVLMALVAGARHRISKGQWDAYAATGTSHLMAISGLHIGLAAGFAFLLAWGILAILPGARNYRDCAIVVALLAAIAYAGMSGLAVPARRACLMLSIAAVMGLCRRETPAPELLAATLIVVALSDPLSLLAPGFGLSFAAVTVLLWAAHQRVHVSAPGIVARPATPLLRLWFVQLALLAGLFPLTVSYFSRFSLVAPAVNFMVLPIFNFATVPLALLGATLDGPFAPLGDRLLGYAHDSVEVVLGIIGRAESAEWLTYRTAVPVSLVIASLPLVYVLFPPGWPGRRLAALAALYVINAEPARIPDGCFDYHVLDVGQGLAVLVQTRAHGLLFDTGPSFRSGANTAEFVIRPFLASAGIRRLDTIIVSHADLDHSGGIDTLLTDLHVGRILSGEPLAGMRLATQQCAEGDGWHWDGVEFRILHPRMQTPWRGNNASCVLEVSAGANRLLLTGDIESPVETLLGYRKMLRNVRAVTVPHHGSRTSSGDALIEATRPELAIVSAGRSNRWGFPKPDVVHRWQAARATVLNTATSGAISQRLCANGLPDVATEARRARSRYWHER